MSSGERIWKTLFHQFANVMELVRQGNRDPEEVSRVLQNIISPPINLFISPDEQLRLFKTWNHERGWGFTDEHLDTLGEPPAWPTDDPLAVVILDISLGSIQQTFDEAVSCICLGLETKNAKNFRAENVASDDHLLKLCEGMVFEPMTLKWRVMDLGVNREKSVKQMRLSAAPELLPHSAILWAAAFFPDWALAMDGKKVPFVKMAGYRMVIPGMLWERVPSLVQVSKMARLEGELYNQESRRWAAPVFLES